MILRKRLTGSLLAVAAAAIVACGGGSSEPEFAATPDGGTPQPAPTSETAPTPGVPPAPTAEPTASGVVAPTAAPTAEPTASGVVTPTAAPISQTNLPTREVVFRVRVPDNHPDGGRVVLMTMPPGNVVSLDRVELEPDPFEEGVFFGAVAVEEGALLRYTYDRWDGQDVAGWDAFRETAENLYQFVNRYVLVTDELDLVEDAVALWRDLPGPHHEGVVTGTVMDMVTGAPVVDATVSVSGVHTATDWRGEFAVRNLPDGEHRAIVFTTLGDYKAQQFEFDIEDGVPDAEVRFLMEPAQMVPVTFDVALPDSTPPEAEIAIAGNLWQLGGRLGGYPFQPDYLNVPALDRVSPRRAVATFDLYEGTYVSYTYTLRPVAEGTDRSDSGAVFRSFIVRAGDGMRSDAVERWNNGDWPIVTLRVEVPENTTPGVPVGIVTGPTAWLSQTGPFEWVGYLPHNPPGSEYNFGINLGADAGGQDGSPGAVDGRRTGIIPDDGGEIAIRVTKWERLPDPAARQADSSLDVTFRVSVPPETPPDATVLLSGDRAAVSGGVVMQRRPDNPWLFETTVAFTHDGPLEYGYEVAGAGPSTRSYSVFTRFDGQVVNDWVGGWEGVPGAGDGARPEWRSGIYLPDFWSTSFEDTSESAFERIRDAANGEWVALSSVWSFGRLQPTPTIESRPVEIWTVMTPLKSIRLQAAQAHAAGLNVFLAPQQNPEVLPGWNEPPLNERDREWWEAWLVEAERQWMWNAAVAEEIGAEMLLLPGPVFHIFPSAAQFDGDPFEAEFDARVASLVEQVRGVYNGAIMISGSNPAYEFPGLADVRGVTTFDLGIPALPDSATVAEWKDAYRANFESVVDPIRERWDGPVMFYTVHAPPTGSGVFGDPAPAGDAFGEHTQANRLEALYQLIAERPWVQGAMSWSYDYIDAPNGLSDGVRGRLGEAVQAKWYDRLSGGTGD